MFCQSCGKIIPEDAKFCRYCGKEITNIPFEASKENSSELSNSDKQSEFIADDRHQKNYSKSSGSFRGFVIICIIALAIAGGLIYWRSSRNVNFDNTQLKNYTCTGLSSLLSINTPFDLTDENTGPLDEGIEKMIYKTGAADNFSIEVVGIKYNLDISMLDYEDAMDFMVESLKEDSGNSNIIKKGSIDKVTISGNKYAKQVINFYDKKSGLHLESILIMGIKNNELWFVTISYKNGDVKANAFANKIMSTVDLK